MMDTQAAGAGQLVRLEASDGFCLDAFEVEAPGTRRGGVVILQEIFGVTDQLRSVARDYASAGFDAVVPALFDRAAPGTVIPFREIDRARETMQGLDKDKTLIDIESAVRRVDRGGGVSAVGFCWGGGLAVRAACELELVGAVSFYGTALATHFDRTPRCPLLFHFGEGDSHSPPEIIEGVEKAFPSATRHTYDAGHAFANQARPEVYVAEAAKTAHARTLDFLCAAHAG